MQILVDVSLIARADAHTGIQRVVRGILRPLLIAPPAGYETVPVRAGRWLGYRYAGSYAAKLVGRDGFPSGKVRASAGDIFLALDLAPGILPRHQGQLARWKRSGARLWFFLHDLLPVSHPEWFTAAGVRNFARWMQCVATHADGVICTTRSVAGEFRDWLKVNRHRGIAVDWVPLGADLDATAPSTGLPADFGALTARLRSAPVVLMVGRIEPRKGHAQTLSAFELLWRQGRPAHLVIVGSVGWRVDELVHRLRRHLENGKRLFWLEGISDEALCRLYELADGVLLASEGEGFGLPLVEAARHGKPILARDIPVYRETAQDHALYFSGPDAHSLATALASWLESIRAGNAPSSSGVPTSTWAESAHRINEILVGARSS